MTTTIKPTMRRLAASIAIIIALVTTSARAAHPIYWKGGNGSEASPVNIYSKSSWVGEAGGTTYSGDDISDLPSSMHNMHFGFAAGAGDTTAWLKSDGTTASTVIAAGVYTHNGSFIFKASGGKVATVEAKVGLSAGVHAIRLSNASAWMPDIDRMTIARR